LTRMVFPTEIRASWLARHFYCAEQAYIKAHGLNQNFKVRAPPSFHGEIIHRQLAARIGTPETEFFKNYLAELEPLSFKIFGTRVFFHPDDFRVRNGKVRVIEEKTVTSKKITFYKFCIHKFQLEIYVFGLNEILPEEYQLEKIHWLRYWKRTQLWQKLKLVKLYPILIHPKYYWIIKDNIHQIFQIWRGKDMPQLPARWKCQKCPDSLKLHCRIYRRKIRIPRTEWEVRFR